MKQLRDGMAQTHSDLDAEVQVSLFTATSLFERVIWLVHRFAELMEQREALS